MQSTISLILSLLQLVGIIFGFTLIVFILIQYARYVRTRRFIFEGFSNASKLIEAKKRPLDFDMLAREELVHQFKAIYIELKEYLFNPNQGTNISLSDELYFEDVPQIYTNQINQSGIIEDLKEVFKILNDPEDFNLKNLAEVIGSKEVNNKMYPAEEIAPKEVVPIIKFIESIIPPDIIRAIGHLQWRSDLSCEVGITFEFVDLGKQRNLMVRTIWWQPSNTMIASEDTQKPVESNLLDEYLTNKMADKYIELLSPAMYWLAMMFWEQKLISHIPFRNRILKVFENRRQVLENRRQACIYYLIGALYNAHADQFESYKLFFLQLTFEHFRLASSTDSHWCLPSLYLANLYSFKMIETSEETTREMHGKLLDEALRLYEEALERADRTNESIYTQQRIILARALAELNSANEELIEKAKKEVQDITANEGPASPANFDPSRADCASYLYNLARWYELSLEIWAGVPGAIIEARRYLAYSLARSQNQLNSNQLKIHFKLLFEDGDLEVLPKVLGQKLSEERKLEKELGQKLSEESKLATMRGDNFKMEIDKILETVDQILNRTG